MGVDKCVAVQRERTENWMEKLKIVQVIDFHSNS